MISYLFADEQNNELSMKNYVSHSIGSTPIHKMNEINNTHERKPNFEIFGQDHTPRFLRQTQNQRKLHVTNTRSPDVLKGDLISWTLKKILTNTRCKA